MTNLERKRTQNPKQWASVDKDTRSASDQALDEYLAMW